jgi:hypothetical protein
LSDFAEAFQDAFNLLCGKKIGEGIHRNVFECRVRPDLVVKVETDEWRYFANVLEMKFWSDHQHYAKVADWLAPCEFMSPDGRVLLQKRVLPLRDGDALPPKLPSFLSDVKRDNFGLLEGRIVCMDYAMTIPSPSVRPKKVDWT